MCYIVNLFHPQLSIHKYFANYCAPEEAYSGIVHYDHILEPWADLFLRLVQQCMRS